MQLTVATWDDRIINIEVDPHETVDNLKAILEAEAGLPMEQQTLVFQNAQLASSAKLSDAGVGDGAVLMLIPAQPPQQNQRQPAARQQPENPALAMNPDGTAKAPVALIQTIKGDPAQMQMLESNNPALARAIRNEDINAVQDELKRVHHIKLEQQAALQQEQELLMADPFDIDAQRKIEELIQQKNIEENMAAALEHSPEVFGSVEMLYVHMEVNGVPVKTFVDSGAQTTIMTFDFAEKCFLTRLIDKRFAGVAVGVGSSKIVGRIHQAPLNIAGNYITSSITVLEQKDGPQFIFGLDMLKRHQCCIDLSSNLLRFSSVGVQLRFLPDHEIPKDFKRHIEQVSQQEAERNMAAAKNNPGTASASAEQPAAATPMDTAPSTSAQPTPSSTPAPPTTSTPTPPPAPSTFTPPVPPSQLAAAAATVSESSIQGLVSLGFSREQALQALQSANGDIDLAASLLFGGF